VLCVCVLSLPKRHILVSPHPVPSRLAPLFLSFSSGIYALFSPLSFPQPAHSHCLLFAAFLSVMSSADAASVIAASSPPTSGPLSPSSSGTGQVDPPSELHAHHPTISAHVTTHLPTTDAVSVVLDSRVDGLGSGIGDNPFMIIEGESQDDSVDDVSHEGVDVQGREGVMVMDNGDDGQQWFHEHENHELKRVKVRSLTPCSLFSRCMPPIRGRADIRSLP
jgi:hypothetical protein